MWPEIYLPGADISFRTYQLLNVAGWVAFPVVGLALTRSRPDLSRYWWWLFLGSVVSYSVGSSAVYRLLNDGDGGPVWLEFRTQAVPGGYYGGALLFLAWTSATILACRIRAYPFLDAFAIAFSASQAFAKAACLAAGCCYGAPWDGPLGLAYCAQGDPTPRFPIQAAEAGLHLLTALCLGLLYARGKMKGRLILLLGAAYGAWRLGVEPFRAKHAQPLLGGPLTTKQVAGLLVLAFSLTYLLLDFMASRRKRG
jgi:prolipoprotein diacylglyceryltransferase